MTAAKKVATKTIQPKLQPINPEHFGSLQHKVLQFSVVVSGSYTKKDLSNPDLWANCARNFQTMGDCHYTELNIIADDMSFIARGICTFVQGSTAKIKIVSFNKLDSVDADFQTDEASNYTIDQRGIDKWCIVHKTSGEIVKKNMANQKEAIRELEDYQKMLRT